MKTTGQRIGKDKIYIQLFYLLLLLLFLLSSSIQFPKDTINILLTSFSQSVLYLVFSASIHDPHALHSGHQLKWKKPGPQITAQPSNLVSKRYLWIQHFHEFYVLSNKMWTQCQKLKISLFILIMSNLNHLFSTLFGIIFQHGSDKSTAVWLTTNILLTLTLTLEGQVRIQRMLFLFNELQLKCLVFWSMAFYAYFGFKSITSTHTHKKETERNFI